MLYIIERYFSFEGRLARIPFFVRNMYLGIALGIGIVAGVPLISRGGALWYVGVLVILGALALALWSQVTLVVRRLHDMGFSGYHVIWIGVGEVLSTGLSYGSDVAVLLSLPFLLVSLGLLFWPGKSDAVASIA
jgi:uncharacterized membrane protein YhaH (DUF805 family)